MKRLLIVAAALVMTGLSFTGCTEKDFQEPDETLNILILTFEDADYKAGENYIGETSWSSLIDVPQNGGPLLYGEDYNSGSGYCWYDENNTFLRSEILKVESYTEPGTYTTAFWNGGHAVSNYASTDIEANKSYLQDLTVYGTPGKGGHNGSANFCVHTGAILEGSTLSEPFFEFGDNVARVIDHMYVNSTIYMYECYVNGSNFTTAASDDDYVKIIATGYDAEGNATGTSEFALATGKTCIREWTQWNLRSLGKVVRVSFNIIGTDMGDFGLNTPGYFAYDDVAVLKF